MPCPYNETVFERSAPTDHEIFDLLARRWSTRAYTEQSIDPETLRRLFEAARWAPSSGNGQPWNFLVARKENAAEFEKIANCLNPGNAWAKSAAVLAISVASLDRSPGKPNPTAHHDVGLACENMAIQATALGLSLHMMGGFSHEKARATFAIPDRWEPIAAISIGHPGDPNTLPDELRAKDLAPRHRKPIREFVFSGTWGQSGLD
jgi:nitroreductase